jgi:hypothetical protein
MARHRSRLAAELAPVVITADGMAWCTICQAEPEYDPPTYEPLLIIWARHHLANPSECATTLANREAAMRRHPAGKGRRGA